MASQEFHCRQVLYSTVHNPAKTLHISTKMSIFSTIPGFRCFLFERLTYRYKVKLAPGR